MSRARIVFFGILALYVIAIAAALMTNVAGLRFLRGLFIASTIFSVGVVLLDLLGLLGEHHGAATDGGHTSDTGGGWAGDHTTGHLDDHGAAAGGHEASPTHGVGAHEPVHGHDTHPAQQMTNPAPILSALAYLRLFVYFCLGFGPVGWIGLQTGRSALVSLLLAAGVGVLAVLLAQAFFRFQRKDTDSQLAAQELIGQRGVVIVPLDAKTMGRIRIQVGLMVTEQYALAATEGAAFRTGDEVGVVKVSDECVYVR